MEKLLASEDFDEVKANFARAYEGLETLLKERPGFGKQKSIRKALTAFDLTVDLMKELLAKKHELTKESSLDKKTEQKKRK